MGSFSGLCIGLSFLFGCILMGLVAEVFYLLWWKRRIVTAKSSTTTSSNTKTEEEFKFSFSFSFPFFWKKQACFELSSNTVSKSQEQHSLEMGSSKNMEGVETELMRMNNLYGPPTYLFTIAEETREELESNDGKSRKGSRARSLSDIAMSLASPAAKSPFSADAYNHHEFNPLFDDVTAAAELSRLRSSPPPTFQFLKDAEDKLLRKILAQEGVRQKSLKNEEHLQEYVYDPSQTVIVDVN